MDIKGNYKFVAIEDHKFFDGDKAFTKGTIYEVKDNKLKYDCGWISRVEDTFEKLIECNPSWKVKIVEYKGEETMYEKSYFGYEIIKMLSEGQLVAGQVLNRRGVDYVVAQASDHVYLRDQENDREPRHSIFVDLEHKFIIRVHVIKKVSFLEAYEEYLDGAEIESCDGYVYKDGRVYLDGVDLYETSFNNDELNGEWIVRK